MNIKTEVIDTDVENICPLFKKENDEDEVTINKDLKDTEIVYVKKEIEEEEEECTEPHSNFNESVQNHNPELNEGKEFVSLVNIDNILKGIYSF